MELESIPGVGEKTADSLRTLEDPETALAAGDVAELARAPGVTEGRAARIARGAIRKRHDDTDRVLATDRAREVYDEVLDLLQDRAVTDYAASRLKTLYPSANRSRIEEVREFARAAADRNPDEATLSALADVEPLVDPAPGRIRDRCLAVSDAEQLALAQNEVPELSAEVVDDARELQELARSYPTVIVLDESFAGLDITGDVRVLPDGLERPAEVVPERLLAFFATNRSRLEAAAAVHETADIEPACDLSALRAALSDLTDDGSVVGDEELERLSIAVDDLDAAVGTAESIANDHLREAIREQNVTIEGQDFLSLVEQGARVDSLLSRELADEFDAAIQQARKELTSGLQLRTGEQGLAERVFSDDPTFPVERNEKAVSRLRTELTASRDQRASQLKADLAAELADLREPAERLVQEALELDVELAVARFTQDFGCTMPTLTASGIDIAGGRSPILDVGYEAVEPVDYQVEGVTLLSGVNSGGKTSTIDLVAVLAVLAQMGLPVPATEARLEVFSEIHYYAKSQGTLDAGAFESTLREFGELVSGAANRLVLVDELESITEPGASAKIIAGILEELASQDATAVFVSHLARQIREAAATDVAVDGIEAEGLVEGKLRVNRSPRKNHLARSTPELIVEKLATDGTGDADFYNSLLEKF
ncbi:MAG: DNA mismatch repair protein, MutS family [uncultured archaeon A07HR60]|nr:MAG: DNA mismatch repair protein, MutS family [uncultured archaeon A07HR60]